MLTAIPPALLHRVRDAAAWVHDLASLGLALLCPCGDDHGPGAQWLTATEDDAPAPAPEDLRPGAGSSSRLTANLPVLSDQRAGRVPLDDGLRWLA